jgi:hypothetical protein
MDSRRVAQRTASEIAKGLAKPVFFIFCFFPKIIRNDKSVLRFDAGFSISPYPRVCLRACPA